MLKCFDSSTSLPQNTQKAGDASEATDIGTAIIQAVYDAVDVYDADIINMSWTLNQDSEELHEAICYAAKQNVLLVAAAGNLSLSHTTGKSGLPCFLGRSHWRVRRGFKCAGGAGQLPLVSAK